MYGIFTYIYHTNQPNVGKYIIHGSYGQGNSPPNFLQHKPPRPSIFRKSRFARSRLRLGKISPRKRWSRRKLELWSFSGMESWPLKPWLFGGPILYTSIHPCCERWKPPFSWSNCVFFWGGKLHLILLMDAKSTTWDGKKYPANNGISTSNLPQLVSKKPDFCTINSMTGAENKLVGSFNPFEKYDRQIGSWNPK